MTCRPRQNPAWTSRKQAQSKLTWETNHRTYKSCGGYWHVVYRRSESDGWNYYFEQGKLVVFQDEQGAKSFIERKRLDALCG